MEFNITHGVNFNEINSYNDLGLILKSKVIGVASPKTEYVSIMGRNGDIDLTNALSDLIYYNDRTLQFEFMSLDPMDWSGVASEVVRKIHGKKMQIILDEDPQYFYIGRVKVDNVTTNKKALLFKVTCICEPYKYNIDNGGGNWLWDTFSFEYGVIRDYSKIDINGTESVIVEVEDMPYIPTIVSDSDNLTVEYEGVVYQLVQGNNKFDDMIMTKFSKVLVFKGKGSVSIIYQGGVL